MSQPTHEELLAQLALLQEQMAHLQKQLADQPPPPSAANAESSGISVAKDVKESTLVTGDNNSLTHIRNIYVQAPGAALLDEQAFDQALDRYLTWVVNRFGQLNLRGIERREHQVLDLTLEDVYVSLVATLTPDRKAKLHRGKKEIVLQESQAKPLDMNQLLALSDRLMIVGGPGSGKTTYLHIIASALAQALRSGSNETVERYLGLSEPLPLPILVPLSEFNKYRQQLNSSHAPRDGTLIAFISHWLIRQEAAIGLPIDFFERLLIQGRSCILLLDGLDEVANERERAILVQSVKNVANNGGLRQIVVTCRTRAYRGDAVLPEEFREAEVQPMTLKQVDALTARWCAAAYSPLDAEKESEQLKQAIQRMEDVRAKRSEARLIDSPLLVTIVAIVHYNQHRLPDERAELYEKCIEVLLAEKHHPVSETTFALADWGGSLTEKRNLLAYLAYQMMSAGEKAGRSVSEAQLETWLRPHLALKRGEAEADAALASFIAAMRERSSLLEERGGDYRFLHLTFQEYLCAYYLAESVRDLDKIVEFLTSEARPTQSWWRETILLVIGYLGLRSQENALTLVRRLAASGDDDIVRISAGELAASAFLELNSKDSNTSKILSSRLVKQLTDISLNIPAIFRASAGNALDRIGDPRSGVGIQNGLPDIEWCQVDAGPFIMGGYEQYEGGQQFACNLICQSYFISRYPITVAQYQCFVKARGYFTEKYWTNVGWQWRNQRDINGPEEFSEAFAISNHPQVGISWFEAIAYCNWLTEKMGKPIRLPSEAEWERAARHVDGRNYPWGNHESDPPYNILESFTGSTSAVGIFPRNHAVCGAVDMVGNVWEWCSTQWQEDYDDYEKVVKDALSIRDYRVLRGGSFGNRDLNIPCAYRDWDYPTQRQRDFGFRVVVSPGF